MGYAKRNKKIWAHEGQVQRRRNYEHMKAHVLKKGGKRKIAMFQNNKL
jgi:hypothetical protein